MRYRKLGKTGIEVSALGFGMLRPPRAADTQVDEQLFLRMVRHAIDSGVNYLDTAYTYLGGQSEILTGKALRDGYRDKVYITTKCPVWLCKSPADFDRYLDEQLVRLGTDVIDFYFLHGVERAYWEKHVLPLDLVGKLEQAKRAGKIRHVGFSFHDNIGLFKQIIDFSDIWEVAQIQLNYYDVNFQAGTEGMRYAAGKGLGVIIMEPLRGGFLANVPPAVAAVFQQAATQKSPVEWGLDYLWNMPEISLVLSGMSSMQMVEDNLRYAGRSNPGMLSAEDREVLNQATRQFHTYDVIPCTGCAYCSICPKGIAIPKCFEVFNQMRIKGGANIDYRQQYHDYVNLWGALASACVNCHSCEKVCPQHIAIPQHLREVVEAFEA